VARNGQRHSRFEVFRIALKLGCLSFGGPSAHLGYFHQEYVKRRKWLDERTYAELIALCQFLPGPASSQAGIGIGMYRAGLAGGLMAWLGFTLPSALLMAAFAFVRNAVQIGEGWIHGLKIVALAIVAHAVLDMGRKLAAGPARAGIAVLASGAVLLVPSVLTQAAVIVACGILGWIAFRREAPQPAEPGRTSAGTDHAGSTSVNTAPLAPVSRSAGIGFLILFFILLLALPAAAAMTDDENIRMADRFYRSGALVFGGGHVVLPLLERETVAAGLVDRDDFLVGYGAAQALPGPLFAFAAYLGALMAGWKGALLATVAIFLPGFLLVAGTLPFWDALRRHAGMRAALAGINAGVVGILLAALYTPIWTSAVRRPADFALASVLFVLLAFRKAPPWAIVLLGAGAGFLL
jgi:chromate transporter